MEIKYNEKKESQIQTYKLAHEYWCSVESDVNGMLGGFSRLHIPDINGSKKFIEEMRKKHLIGSIAGKALDCGSGIGRVTKHLLLPIFHSVDMVDFSEKFIQQSNAYIGTELNSRVGNKFVESLHIFSPKMDEYDLIWIQWVTGQLTDDHFVEFLRRCKHGIHADGCIIVKDNVISEDVAAIDVAEEGIHFDSTDFSWTRTMDQFHKIFNLAGYEVVLQRRQLHFPRNIYPVWMFTLKPKSQYNY